MERDAAHSTAAKRQREKDWGQGQDIIFRNISSTRSSNKTLPTSYHLIQCEIINGLTLDNISVFYPVTSQSFGNAWDF